MRRSSVPADDIPQAPRATGAASAVVRSRRQRTRGRSAPCSSRLGRVCVSSRFMGRSTAAAPPGAERVEPVMAPFEAPQQPMQPAAVPVAAVAPPQQQEYEDASASASDAPSRPRRRIPSRPTRSRPSSPSRWTGGAQRRRPSCRASRRRPRASGPPRPASASSISRPANTSCRRSTSCRCPRASAPSPRSTRRRWSRTPACSRPCSTISASRARS